MESPAALDSSPYDSDRDPPTESSVTRATSTALESNGALSKEENRFQSAISAWRDIDLTKLVPQLDTIATDIVTHQKDSLLSRKDLAQKTKDFRKLDDATKLAEFKSLLKAYQTFIDLLTNHGKTTSSAFLRVYSAISEAPDPYPLLEASVDSLLLSEDTLPKLSAENEHLQKGISDLTQQLDNSDSQLDQERTARKALEDARDAKIREVESSWKAVMDEKKDNWEAKERSLEEKIESQERLLNELKASYEVAQRLGQNGEDSGETRHNSASAAELEIVSSDLDRTSQRLAEVEARNEHLRTQLAEAMSNTQPTTQEDPNNARLRSENSTLLRKLDSMRLEKDTESRKRETRIRSLEKESQVLERERDNLRERTNSWRDYPEIKQELEIFKSIEFSTLDDDDTDALDEENTDSFQSNGQARDNKDSLEKLLLTRNKKLSNELAVLRVSHQDLQQNLSSLQETQSNTNAELERAQSLNATLETDIVKVQQEASNAFPPALSTTGTYRQTSSTYNGSSFPSRRPGGRASPTSSIISGFDSSSRTTLDAIRAGEPVGGGSGLLPMIQAQRDRFKTKNSQLETDLASSNATISSLRQEVASLQKDNLTLYEKSRYVSTYSRAPPASTGTAYATTPAQSTIAPSDSTPSGLSVSRYASTYENSLTPFAAFRSREHTRAYRRLSLPERIVFSLSRMILANRTSRNLFAFYCVALHMLVLGMLYWMQSVDVSRHASNLGQAALAAGAGAAGTVGGAVGGVGGAAGNGGVGGGARGAAGAGARAGGRDGAHGDWREEGFIADPNA